MSKTGKKKFDRRTMRSFAVSAVFAYDFILKEAAEAEKEKKKEAEAAARKKPPKPNDSVVINKVVGKGTRRRSRMTLLEYEEKYNGKNSEVLQLLGYKNGGSEEPEEPAEVAEKPFDTEEFIQDVLSSQLEEEGADEIIFADLPDYNEYLFPVVNGVIENIGEIDGYIGRNLTGWSIDRVKRTDLAVLRVAVFELLHFRDTVPLQIAINEAVEAAKASDVKSGAFVNGVLAGVVRELEGGAK